MKKNFILSSLLTIGLLGALQAQVGIGTMSPNAQLTIDPGTSDTAPLELTPLTTAPGTNLSGGQMAVINGELYFYDTTRSEWLSVTTMPLTFARNGDIDTQSLYFGGRITNQNAQAVMPLDGTIVHISGISQAVMPLDGTIVHISGISSAGNATKEFQLRIRNGGTNVSATTFNFSGNAYNDTAVDIDFSAGDVIALRARDDGNGVITNPSIIVWVKWRQ